jgi:hypothetical protein
MYFAHAGLGNRLRAHMMAQLYAQRTGRTLLTGWVSSIHLGAGFTDLFAWDGPEKVPFESIRCISYRKGDLSPQGDRQDFQEEMVYFEPEWQFVDKEYLAAAMGEQDYLPAESLHPCAKLQARLDEIRRKWPSSMLGIHVRRGDFVTHSRQAISMERYVSSARKVLASMAPETHVFLASDASDEELQPLQDAFPNRIDKRSVGSRESLDGAEDSLIDMMLLSSTQHLILTPGSTFGEFAALYGRVPTTYA